MADEKKKHQKKDKDQAAKPKSAGGTKGELSEEQLDQVSGGCVTEEASGMPDEGLASTSEAESE